MPVSRCTCPGRLCLQATIEWEAQEEGFLAKILVPEGTQGIQVGTTVALLVEEEADLAAFKDYTPAKGGAAAAKPAAAPAADAAPAAAAAPSGGSFPPHQVCAARGTPTGHLLGPQQPALGRIAHVTPACCELSARRCRPPTSRPFPCARRSDRPLAPQICRCWPCPRCLPP